MMAIDVWKVDMQDFGYRQPKLDVSSMQSGPDCPLPVELSLESDLKIRYRQPGQKLLDWLAKKAMSHE